MEKNTFFNKVDLMDFLNSADPYEFLTKFNAVSTLLVQLIAFCLK